mmetsp:Transcript_58510/g.171152  ORF Transcript_58510/g.171152 Transcript_58510/m.171152 type:complete len:267 (+) Transcript_58510:461-1261(+)
MHLLLFLAGDAAKDHAGPARHLLPLAFHGLQRRLHVIQPLLQPDRPLPRRGLGGGLSRLGLGRLLADSLPGHLSGLAGEVFQPDSIRTGAVRGDPLEDLRGGELQDAQADPPVWELPPHGCEALREGGELGLADLVGEARAALEVGALGRRRAVRQGRLGRVVRVAAIHQPDPVRAGAEGERGVAQGLLRRGHAHHRQEVGRRLRAGAAEPGPQVLPSSRREPIWLQWLGHILQFEDQSLMLLPQELDALAGLLCMLTERELHLQL